MSRPRAVSDLTRSPHSVSLKVLRLSRPRLVDQFPLPASSTGDHASQGPALDLHSSGADAHESFILTPALALPSSFGRAHVGETFSCALCANMETAESGDETLVSRVQLSAEMQSPSGTANLEMEESDKAYQDTPNAKLVLQRIVTFELREEGNHVLAVTVSYVETKSGSERPRTFRKLYQFVGQQLLSVRTKTQLHPIHSKEGRAVYTLEAQLENLGQDPLVLEKTSVLPVAAFQSRSLNEWDRRSDQSATTSACPVLNPRDVLQIAFILHQQTGQNVQQTSEGRTVVGQLSMQWRSTMGEPGSLSTGMLSAR